VGLIRLLFGSVSKRDLSESDWMRGTPLWSRETASGRSVTPGESLQLVAVFACVSLIAETIGTLPLIVYRNLPNNGRERDPQHPMYPVLHTRPNPEMTSVEYREAMVGHLALRGNAYSQKLPLRNGGWELWPLRPDRMTVFRDGRHLRYLYTLPSGEQRKLAPSEVMHIRGMSSDGLIGYSRVTLAREAIGVGLALEEYSARLFSNGAQPGGVLQTPGALSAPAYERLKSSWEAAHQGLDNAHRVAILEEGVEFKSVSLSAVDAQFLEQRRYSRSEIATLFRVPPHMIGDVERSTSWGTGIEQQGIGFVTHTLRPYLVRIEQRIGLDLMPEPTHFAEFLVDGLLRGDLKTRMESYALMRMWGLRSANDIARLENWTPIPADQGGDTLLVPMNMTPARQIGEEPPRRGDGERAVRTETRAGVGGAASRLALAERYARLFTDAIGRIVAREVNDVQQAADRHLNRRNAESFLTWLADYYERLGPIAARTLLPVMLTYGDEVLADAAAEIGSDDSLAEEFQAFISAYARDFGEHHAGQSRTIIEQDLVRASERGDDALLAVTALLGRWSAGRAEQVAGIETVRLSGALTLGRWERGGITRVRWVRQGSRSCPFCTRLNGQVVGILQAFADAGSEVEGDDETPPLKVQRKTTHPPIHGACKCGLRPERG
jgi:HK97 family phage portal protein